MTPGGRKYSLALTVIIFILIAATALLFWSSKIDGNQWLSAIDKVVLITVGYLGSNVVQKIGDSFGNRSIEIDGEGK